MNHLISIQTRIGVRGMRLTAKKANSQSNRGLSDGGSMSSTRFAMAMGAVSFLSLSFGLVPGTRHLVQAACSEVLPSALLAREESATGVLDPASAAATTDVGGLGQSIFTSLNFETANASVTESPEPAESKDGEQYVFKPVLPDPATPSPFKETQDSRVKVKIYPYFDKLQRGGKCPIAIELSIADGWHINANPANSEFAIPTEVKITSKQKVKMTKIKYPQHELLHVDGQDDPSHVYGGRVIIYAMLEISGEETADEAELEVEVKIQACNEKTCEPPETKKLIGKRPLANPGDEIKRIHESKFPKDDDKAKSQDKQVEEKTSAP
ncbi:MAG: protein-disulfide reductase DsbD family protein [Planctomycetaceae bacterium]